MQEIARACLFCICRWPHLARAGCVFAATFLLSQAAWAQTLSNVVSIEFGNIVANGSGTVVLSETANVRTPSGAVLLVSGGTIRRGRFDVTGTPGNQINIGTPTSVEVTGANGGTAFLEPVILGGNIQILPPSGTMTIYFGGTLVFNNAVPPGNFDVNLPVTVTY